MFVYLKNSMGYGQIGEYRVYGKYFAMGKFGPTNIPYKLWRDNRSMFEEVPLSKKLLEKHFDAEFPDITFEIRELSKLDKKVIFQICDAMGIPLAMNRTAMLYGRDYSLIMRAIRERLDELLQLS